MCGTVGAVGRHGVKGVGDREHARAEGDLVALQITGIALSVVALLVGVNDFRSLSQKGDSRDDLVSPVAVLAHDGHFLVRELAWLAQDVVGNGHLADVVQESSSGDHVDLFFRQAHLASDGDGEGGHAPGMAFGLGVLEVERIAQGFEGDVIGLLQVGKRRFPLLGTGGNERLEVGAIGIVFTFQAAILQGTADRGQQLLSLEGLEQVVIRPIAQGLQSHLNVVDRGDHDDRHVRVTFLGTLQEGNPIHFGHHQVGEDQIEFVT